MKFSKLTLLVLVLLGPAAFVQCQGEMIPLLSSSNTFRSIEVEMNLYLSRLLINVFAGVFPEVSFFFTIYRRSYLSLWLHFKSTSSVYALIKPLTKRSHFVTKLTSRTLVQNSFSVNWLFPDKVFADFLSPQMKVVVFYLRGNFI